MYSRYFLDEDGSQSGKQEGEQVFTISKHDVDKVKRKRSYAEVNKSFKKKSRPWKKTDDPYPGPAPINSELLEKHSRGDGVKTERVKTKYWQKMAKRREEAAQAVQETAARTELLLQQESGFLETEADDPEEFTSRITQTQLRKCVDEESAAKGFELNLQQFGPYVFDYTRNGRFLLLGGRKGHVAALDWQEKRLKCEINVQESVHDVKWLHTENMFAVAQKKWTYIYDNQGIELHCIKKLDNVLRMEFLPYHFLLATASETGFLSWLDISIGKMVVQTQTRQGRLPIMCLNPHNAVICLGHSKGIVTMWTPNIKDPVAKMLVHRQPVTSIAIDRAGQYMATAAMDHSLKIWDVRNTYKCLADYKLPGSFGAGNMQFSDRRLLAISCDNEVQIYKDVCTKPLEFPYMTHKVWKSVKDLHFAPFEDVLGIGHAAGFSSILVPGAGEPNFDALEVNPYQTKKQRREAEVKALLEKIQPELISLNPDDLGQIDLFTLQEKQLEQKSKSFVKPAKIDFEPRHKSRGKSGTAKIFHVKKTVQEEEKWRQLKEKISIVEASDTREGKAKMERKAKSLLERL